MMKKLNKQQIALLAGFILSPVFAWSQSTQGVVIPVNNQTLQVQSDRANAQIDLLKEIRKQKPALNSVSNIDIQMISFEAKSGIGGATVYLKINQGMTNYIVVETDPDLFSSSEARSFQRFELKNNDRTRINSAAVYLPQYANVKLNNLTVTLGSAQELAVMGSYADNIVREIGGAPLSDNRDMTPADDVKARFIGANFDPSVYSGSRPVSQPAPAPQVVKPSVAKVLPPSRPAPAPTPTRPVAVRPAPAPAKKPAGNCLRDYRGVVYCKGDYVENGFGYPCTILAIDASVNSAYMVCRDFNDDIAFWRHVDLLRK